jgi:hypothetical protein
MGAIEEKVVVKLVCYSRRQLSGDLIGREVVRQTSGYTFFEGSD